MDNMNADDTDIPRLYPHRVWRNHKRRLLGLLDATDLVEVALEVGSFVEDGRTPRDTSERWLEAAQMLAGYCRQRAGVACVKCSGEGVFDYRHSSGWRGGVGVSSPTYDVCDTCWGTGRSDLVGEDLRAQRERVQQLDAETSLRWFAERVGGGWVTAKYLKAIAEKIGRMRWSGTYDERWAANRTMDAVVDALNEVIASEETER